VPGADLEGLLTLRTLEESLALRERFTELGVIQFEDWTDTGEEYATLDEVSKDRDAASA